jgi:small neutral amino acid transporter SnatA (MarC family)
MAAFHPFRTLAPAAMLRRMAYRERSSSTISLGCLPAALFGLVVGGTGLFAAVMGECADDSGGIRPCPNEQLTLLAITLVTAGLCLLITWATNRMVRSVVQHGRGAIWGVLGGLIVAVALAFATFFLVLNLFGS